MRLAVMGPILAAIACLSFVLAVPALISNRLILFILDPGLPVGVYIWPGMYIIIPATLVAGAIIRRSVATSRLRAGATLVLALGFWTIVLVDIITTPAFVIADSGVVRMRLTGFSPVPYTLKNGKTVQLLQSGLTGSLIINDSPHQARLEEVGYSKYPAFGFGSGRKITPISPYSVAHTDETIDHWGPNDPPPHSVTVSRGSGGAVRRWLTW
jgi:hypothetical protein